MAHRVEHNKKFCCVFRDKVLVCPMKSAPVLLTLSDSKHVVLPVDDDSDLNVVAAFDRRGEYIYTGNAKGKVSPRRDNMSEFYREETSVFKGLFIVAACSSSPSCLPLCAVADSGVEHKHSGVGGFFQSDNWHQQHHGHQID